MSSHLLASAPPVSAVRPTGLGSTGLPGRRALRHRDFRTELRELLPRVSGRHRETFVPLSRFSVQSD
jgi:hypothetical protein